MASTVTPKSSRRPKQPKRKQPRSERSAAAGSEIQSDFVLTKLMGSPHAVCPSRILPFRHTLETKEVLPLKFPALPLLKGNLGSFFASSQASFRCRIVSSAIEIATAGATSATLKGAYDPSAQSDFDELASVFGLYKVHRAIVEIAPRNPHNSSSVADNLAFLLVGSDPSGWITGTPTKLGVSRLSDSVMLNPQLTTMFPHRHKLSGVSKVPQLAPTSDGFIYTSVGWPGQFCVYAETQASSTYDVFSYRVIWDLEFKALAGPSA